MNEVKVQSNDNKNRQHQYRHHRLKTRRTRGYRRWHDNRRYLGRIPRIIACRSNGRLIGNGRSLHSYNSRSLALRPNSSESASEKENQLQMAAYNRPDTPDRSAFRLHKRRRIRLCPTGAWRNPDPHISDHRRPDLRENPAIRYNLKTGPDRRKHNPHRPHAAGSAFFEISVTFLIGDGMFIFAGLMWAMAVALQKKWNLQPIELAAFVSVLGALIYAPYYLTAHSLEPIKNLSTEMLWFMIIIQGVLSGVVALFSFAKAIQLLGAARASLFPALVPAVAILVGIPITGELPTTWQWAGLVIVTVGLITAVARSR